MTASSRHPTALNPGRRVARLEPFVDIGQRRDPLCRQLVEEHRQVESRDAVTQVLAVFRVRVGPETPFDPQSRGPSLSPGRRHQRAAGPT
jgi:hypothetical protein